MKTIITLAAACLMVGCGSSVDVKQMKITGDRGVVIGKMLESDAGDRSSYCYLIVKVGDVQKNVRVDFDIYSSIKTGSTVYVATHRDGKPYLDLYIE